MKACLLLRAVVLEWQLVRRLVEEAPCISTTSPQPVHTSGAVPPQARTWLLEGAVPFGVRRPTQRHPLSSTIALAFYHTSQKSHHISYPSEHDTFMHGCFFLPVASCLLHFPSPTPPAILTHVFLEIPEPGLTTAGTASHRPLVLFCTPDSSGVHAVFVRGAQGGAPQAYGEPNYRWKGI